jgi:dsRNA-specific ribonuclease
VTGNGRSDALALIGQNMLSILFIENAMKRKIVQEQDIAALRSEQLSPDRLANTVPRVLVPDIISEEELELLSVEDKNILLEAYIGAAYENCRYRAPRKFRLAAFDIIAPGTTQGDETPEQKTLQPFTEFLAKINSKKAPRAQLQILLHKRGYLVSTELYRYESLHANDSSQPPFVATFTQTEELVPYGLPAIVGEIKSAKSRSKQIAADQVAKQVMAMIYGYSNKMPSQGEPEEDWHWKRYWKMK